MKNGIKNKMKGYRTVLLSLLFTAAAAVPVFAANGTLYFSDPEIQAGQTVNVNMKVETESPALGRADITLKYPADSLEFLEGHNCDGGAGVIRIHGNVSGGNVSGLDYSISFKALKPGQFKVTVDSAEIYDRNENEVTLSHIGSSTITVSAAAGSSDNASLSSLQVSPGTLTPAFSQDITEYEVNVGLDVESLAVDAVPADGSASVAVSGNSEFTDGDNEVILTVTAPDGTSVREYKIHVLRSAEGAAETAETISESELANGIQLSTKGKTITVMDLPDSMEIPAAFREGTISIDGAKVRGWIWASEESEQPEYIVIYGMNDNGEMNFYRYDMTEKTIQRYFSDPAAADTVPVEEFNEVQQKLNDANRKNDLRLILLCAAAVAAFGLLIAVILLSVRISSLEKEEGEKEYRQKEEKDLLKHSFSRSAEEPAGEEERTVVIRGNEPPARKSREVADETVVIRKTKEKPDDKEPFDGFEEFDL